MFVNNPDPYYQHQNAARSVFMSSLEGLATIMALITMFIASPILFEATKGWAQDFAMNHYGYEWADMLTRFGWQPAMWLAVFFTARATAAVAIASGVVSLAYRFI